MGVKINQATILDSLSDGLMFAVGNTGLNEQESAVTLGQVKDYVDADKATVAFTGSYLNLNDTPNLEAYVLMTTLNQNYYNKNQINQIIGGITGPKFVKVEELPERGENNVIYLLPQQGGGQQNIFDEYVWLPDGLIYEKIGSTQADFDNYYTIDEVDALIPAVGNGTITINQGGVQKGTFTVNQSGNTVINLDEGGGTQVQSDWETKDPKDPSFILNKPTIPYVSDVQITINQGGVNKGSFTLNQGNATTINLDSVSQVNSDWNEDDPSDPSFILNKPVIPTVNNPNIIIKQGGVTKGSFSLNQSGGATISLDSGGGGGTQSNWKDEDSTSMAYIQNKPGTRAFTVTYEDQTQETIEFYVKDSVVSNQFIYFENTYNGQNTVSLETSIMGSPTSGTYSTSVEYSKDGQNWTTMNFTAGTTQTITLDSGEKVWFRNDSGKWNYFDSSKHYVTTITASQNHIVGGNIMSLIDYTDMANASMSKGCFAKLFEDDTKLTDSSLLSLPATTLADWCYYGLFSNCNSMTTGQTELPATTMADSCYKGMYSGTMITTAPILPATNLAYACYSLMFAGCPRLVNPPSLPATTLAVECYYQMFSACRALTTGPVLPAKTLVGNCYGGLFENCTNLNSVTTYADDISASYCITLWLDGVAASGTLHNLGNATYPSGASGIPSGWTETNQ